MAASALNLSPRSQQLPIPLTPSAPGIETTPLSSSPAHSHPQRSARRQALHSLRLTATHTTSEAPCHRLTAQDGVPPLITTGAHEAQSVTWTEAPLPAPQVWTGHLGLPHFKPVPTCWAPTTTAKWVVGRLGQTEAPLLCLLICQGPARYHGISAASSILVSGCRHPAVKQSDGSCGPQINMMNEPVRAEDDTSYVYTPWTVLSWLDAHFLLHRELKENSSFMKPLITRSVDYDRVVTSGESLLSSAI